MIAKPVSANNSFHAEDTEERLRLRDIENENVARESADVNDENNENDRRNAASHLFENIHHRPVSIDNQEFGAQVANLSAYREPAAVEPPTFAEIDQGFNTADFGIEMPVTAKVSTACGRNWGFLRSQKMINS